MSSVKKTRKKQLSSGKQKKEIRTRTRTTSKTYSTLKKRDTHKKKGTKIKSHSYSSSRNEDEDEDMYNGEAEEEYEIEHSYDDEEDIDFEIDEDDLKSLEIEENLFDAKKIYQYKGVLTDLRNKVYNLFENNKYQNAISELNKELFKTSDRYLRNEILKIAEEIKKVLLMAMTDENIFFLCLMGSGVN